MKGPPRYPRKTAAQVLGTLHQAKLWALARSSSLVGLLYLPVPDDPIPAPRPRTAPTPIRRFDPIRLLRGEALLGGRWFPIRPPVAWRPAEPDLATALVHHGEEVLALLRLARAQGKPEAGELARRLVLDWVEQNPVASLPGWSPGAIGRRLACWSTAYAEESTRLPPDEQRRWRQSLFLQARFLASNLERWERGPRLLTGLRALLGAASVLTGSEPRRWSLTAERLLPGAIEAQVLPDGGHVSRSPAIHLRALADLADVLALLAPEERAAAAARQRLPAMARLASALAHPDGGPAGFAGSSRDRAPEPFDLFAAIGLEPPALPAAATFPDAGFSAFRAEEPGDAVLVDWLGPATGTPGPGAAGSIEVSFSGERVVVTPFLTSPGASDRAHNSATADGRAFRSGGGRRTALDEGIWGEGPGFAYVGLKLRQGAVSHHRRVLVFDRRALAIVDRVQGATTGADSLLQLDHGFRVREAGERRLFLERDGLTVTLAWMAGAEASAFEGAVTGRQGERLLAPAIRLRAPAARTTTLGYLLVEGRRRDAAIDHVPGAEERIDIRFDPRRWVVRWETGSPPRLLVAD